MMCRTYNISILPKVRFHFYALVYCFCDIYYFKLIKERGEMKGLSEPAKGFLISCDKNREK